MAERVFQGIPAAGGVAIGAAYLYHRPGFSILRRTLRADEVERELERYWGGLDATRAQLEDLVMKVKRELGDDHAAIFKAHQVVLDDPLFVQEIPNAVRQRRLNAEFLLKEELSKLKAAFESIGDSYFKERGADLDDVGNRVLKNLMGHEREVLRELDRPVILVAEDLSPSDSVTLSPETVKGFATDVGGRTSHVAIVARSLGIPAVVGLQTASSEIQEGDLLVVDGSRGLLVQNPSSQTLKRYRVEKERYDAFFRSLEGIRRLPPETPDGRRIILAANIELPSEVDNVISHGAEGVGLFRTEFLFLGRESAPTEEEQVAVYREVAEKLGGSAAVVRTLDLGGDKYLSHLNPAHENNPFLGLRAIRLCLQRPDLFRTQLRAILRASVYGNLKVMFPMITSLQEFREARRHLEECKRELMEEGIPFDRGMEVGAMVEVPSAAVMADVLAREADFLSVGTNDLIQYTLAVDRVNEAVAYLYDPLHPAVLRLVRCVVEACHRFGKWAGMCGEMAGDPRYVPLLIGLGLDELSCSLSVVPEVKKVVRLTPFALAQEIAREALTKETSREVEEILRRKSPKELQEVLF